MCLLVLIVIIIIFIGGLVMFDWVRRRFLRCEFLGASGPCENCQPSRELSQDLFYCGRYKVLKDEGS